MKKNMLQLRKLYGAWGYLLLPLLLGLSLVGRLIVAEDKETSLSSFTYVMD